MRSCHRQPRTTQERRENGKRDYIVVDGYRIRTRAKRNVTNLVEAWDDITLRTDWRCWKRYRKNQYKGKIMKLEEHEDECLRVLGKPFTEVHQFLDQFAGKPECGMRHRCKLHHEAGIELVRQQFGEEAAKAARLHIEADLMQEGWKALDKFPKNEREYKDFGFF